MPEVEDVLQARLGLVVAPAGCGKTQLIVNALAVPCEVPSLVLTHTTAGVAALRHRLNSAGVPSSHYKLATIAGWALNILSMFPERTGYTPDPINPPNYPEVQNAVAQLCGSGHIDDVLAATYSRLLVDEYQDCSISQHSIVIGISRVLPTVIFGDPLQAIFGFGADGLPNWDTVVVPAFPLLGILDIPWRWDNVGAHDLGCWLLTARTSLINRELIDLRSFPDRIFWHQITGDVNADMQAQVNAQYHISRNHPNEKLLIVGDSMLVNSRHQYASRSVGVGVVEPVDLRDIVRVATSMENLRGMELFDKTIEFLIMVMTNVRGDVMLRRLESIANGRNRNTPTPQELTAIELINNGGYTEAVLFMASMNADRERRVYRKSAFNVMYEALKLAAPDQEVSLTEIVAQIREQKRHAGRAVPYKAVGSTLLLKGLEADHVLILDADLPRNIMSREHLYVALSRGAKSITIFSRNPLLPAA